MRPIEKHPNSGIMMAKVCLAAKYLLAAILVVMLYRIIYQHYSKDTHKKYLPASKLRLMSPSNLNKTPKRIALWTSFFGSNTWTIPWPSDSLYKEMTCSGSRRCLLSVNRTDPLSHDALLFHGRDQFTIPAQRHPGQVYIMYMWESPAHEVTFVSGGSFYNWTSTYCRQSDIVMHHGSWFKLPQRNDDALTALPQLKKKRPNGTATILWIVSNCGGHGRRRYVDELQRHIKVDVFGGCGKPCPNGTGGNSPTCYERLAKTGHYKFYLAFENSVCPDYISLKPYRALNNSLIPIVLGGTSAADYIGLFPPNAHIDVRNFTSPKHLAEYLQYIDAHDDAYLAYHEWRKDYMVRAGLNPFCQICDALYNSTMMKPRNVDFGEFWSAGKCDGGLVKRLLEPPPPNTTKPTPI